MIYQTINRKKILKWACSSMVERYVDIVEAISSILITPTIDYLKPYFFIELREIDITEIRLLNKLKLLNFLFIFHTQYKFLKLLLCNESLEIR